MDANIRNFKDFLQIYNLLSQTCFSACVDNLNRRSLEDNEIKCVEGCAEKFIRLNHRFMGIYVESQQLLVNKRLKEAEEQAKLAPKVSLEETVNNNNNISIDDKSDISAIDNLTPLQKDVSVS